MARLLGSNWGSFNWGSGTLGDLVLPDALLLKGNNQDTKAETWSLTFADGSYSAGDEVKPRVATLEGTFGQMDRDAFRTICDQLRYNASRPGLKLQLVPDGGYLNLSRFLGVDEDPEALMDWSVAKVRLTWQCDDPFWYAPALETRTFALSGNTTITINAGKSAGFRQCLRGCSPTIKVTSPGFLPVPTFTLRNVSDEGLTMRYSDPLLKLGNYATIDCAKGTATREGGANTIRYLEGEFIRLLTQNNRLEYEGTTCTLAISWRPRWL